MILYLLLPALLTPYWLYRDPPWPSGNDAWFPSVSSQVGLVAILMCGVLEGCLLPLLQLKDPLELFVKRKEFLPGSGFLSRRDVT